MILSLFTIALFALLTLAERLALPWAYQPRRSHRMKRLSLLCCRAAVAVAGRLRREARPADARPSQSLSLMLDWFPNADHVGLYQALAEGDFSKAGLDVHVEIPSNPSSPLQLLAAGKVDFAISYEPEVLLARNQGMPLVSVAAIVQRPLTSIVSVGSKHIVAAQLRGKTRRRRRDPVPARLPRHDPRARGRPSELGSRGQRRREPRAGDALRQGRRHPRRLLELRGDPARANGQEAERDPGQSRRRPDLRRARARRSPL